MAFSVSTNVYESDVNVNNNTSKVTLQVTLNSTYGSWFGDNKTGTLVIDGTSYSITYNFPSGTTSKVLGSATKTITHNDDGSKTANWSYSLPTNSSQGTKTGSGSITLTTIARASTPSVSSSSVNLGSSVTINTNRASSNFTHTITYSIGSLTNQTSGLSASTNVGTSCTFTPPASLANQFPNAKSGTVTITCKTYNGSTLLGTKTCTLTVNTIDNSTYKPTISLTATGSNLFNSKYLNQVSGVTISATTGTKYSATVNSYIITGGSKSSTNANLVVSPINISMSSASQSISVSGTVTDSRGYTGTGTTSVTIYRYNVPQITEYSIARCTSDGTLATNGTYAKVGLTYTYQNDGYSNSMSVHKININGADTTITTTETTSSGVVTGTGTAIVGDGNLGINNHYSYTITCTDAVGKTTSVNGVLQTASRIINVRPGGLGIAVGKFAETDNLFDSAWDIKATNFQGTSTNATNVNIAQTNPTSGTWYYMPFMTGQSGNQRERANDGLRYYSLQGTASAMGTAYIQIGNGTATGTAGNKKGILRLHGSNTGRTDVSYANTTTSTSQTIPALNGTFVVKQSATISTETNGWYKVDMGAYTQYFKSGEFASKSYATGWGWHSDDSVSNLKLPSGITFNNAKMIFTGCERAGDSALSLNCGCTNGGSYVTSCWKNSYSSAVTTKVYYNWSLIVFP